MTQSKIPKKPQPATLDAHQFPLHAQTEDTAGRDKVRQVLPVRAPRQSKRPAERTGKGRGD